jgi:outer membrane receptor for ferrienterochelin and colicins
MQKPFALPRLSVMFTPLKPIQLRVGYARGFRPPQAFDTDLHLAFAGGGVSTVRIAPHLLPEHAQTLNVSADLNMARPQFILGFTLNPFLTVLEDAFVLEELAPDGTGNRRFEKRNGNAATVRGFTLEARLNWKRKIEWDAGFTFQESRFTEPVAWSENAAPSRDFMRTPGQYGFSTLRYSMRGNWQFSLAAIYTGIMQVPHLAGAPKQPADALTTTSHFADITGKVSKVFGFKNKKERLKLYAGIGNILNHYQRDFDTTRYRDSNYIYGPSRPRHVFAGVVIGIFE